MNDFDAFQDSNNYFSGNVRMSLMLFKTGTTISLQIFLWKCTNEFDACKKVTTISFQIFLWKCINEFDALQDSNNYFLSNISLEMYE